MRYILIALALSGCSGSHEIHKHHHGHQRHAIQRDAVYMPLIVRDEIGLYFIPKADTVPDVWNQKAQLGIIVNPIGTIPDPWIQSVYARPLDRYKWYSDKLLYFNLRLDSNSVK